MENVTAQFGRLYHPKKAFVIYQPEGGTGGQSYIESYDMDKQGRPINAHPLSIRESTVLAKALNTSAEVNYQYLKPAGLMPGNVLFLNPDSGQGYVIWYTPSGQADLYFKEELNIPNGKANLPALIWKASLNEVAVYAVKNGETMDLQTSLYHAPFFNVYSDGRVCMGNVNIKISKDCRLEEFMTKWETAFYNSYFSHLFSGHSPVKGNIVTLWKNLIGTKKKFPEKVLRPNKITIKNLLK